MKKTLAMLVEAEARRHPGQSALRLLADPWEAFLWRLALVDTARHSIHLQYYLWNVDTTGTLLVQRLLRAADRGVQVRVLLDDFNICTQKDRYIGILNTHPNIEVRIYNPISKRRRSALSRALAVLKEFDRINRRMHSKVFLVDDQVALIGGRNIGDPYFGLSKESNFLDLDVLMMGPVVNQVVNSFHRFWKSTWSCQAEEAIAGDQSTAAAEQALNRIRSFSTAEHARSNPENVHRDSLELLNVERFMEKLMWAEAEVVTDIPGREQAPEELEPHQSVARRLLELIRQASQSVLIGTPYLIPGQVANDTFGKLAEAGIQVSVATNSLASTDVLPIHAGYTRWRRDVLRKKVRLFELKPYAQLDMTIDSDRDSNKEQADSGPPPPAAHWGLHGKSMAVDRSLVYVGSFNLNLRSVYLNAEIGLIARSSSLAEQVSEHISALLETRNSWRLGLDARDRVTWLDADSHGENAHRDPGTSAWRRLKIRVMALFPIDKYL